MKHIVKYYQKRGKFHAKRRLFQRLLLSCLKQNVKKQNVKKQGKLSVLCTGRSSQLSSSASEWTVLQETPNLPVNFIKVIFYKRRYLWREATASCKTTILSLYNLLVLL